MARPRVLKYGEGEIKLMNLSKEEADKIQALIEGAPSVQMAVAMVPVETKGEYTDNAVGLYQDETSKRYFVVNVNYNKNTGEARVVEQKDVGPNKYSANDKFKEMVVKKGIIKI